MSISRRRPKTVRETKRALAKLKARKDIVAPAEMTLSTATQTAVDDTNTSFRALVATMVLALYNQLRATNAMETAKGLARMFISHYFQAYNNGITRGDFDKESRVLYGLSENQSSVPPLSSEADITDWGDAVVTGDAARVTAGGSAMSNPTAAAVSTKVSDFNTKNGAQGLKKTAFSTAEQATMAALPAAILVVVKGWDETETFYDNLPIESMRAKAIEWGVVYESTQKITINVVVKNSVTAALLAGAVTTVLESGTEHTSNGVGEEVIETNIAFGITLETVLDTYVTNETPVEFETGVTEYNVVIEMVPE